MNAPLKHTAEAATDFVRRHIGPSPRDVDAMLETVGANSLGELMGQTLPSSIRQKAPLDLGRALSETEALAHMGELAAQNQVFTSLIGQGYSGTILPAVIQRNILENPGLVHGVHALSAGDQPGPAGGLVQLPNHDLRSYRARCRERLAAR